MSKPKAYEPQQGYRFQLLTKHPDQRELEHCDYAVDQAEKQQLLEEYQLAYRGQGITFKVIEFPQKYWSTKPKEPKNPASMRNKRVRKWYKATYPNDEMGDEIDGTLTFNYLWKALQAQMDIYEVIGAHDSIVRERVFDKLAEVMNVDYSVIYNQWLKGD